MAKSEPFGTTYVQRIMVLRSLVGYGSLRSHFGYRESSSGRCDCVSDAVAFVCFHLLILCNGRDFGKAEASAILISLTGVVLISRPSLSSG